MLVVTELPGEHAAGDRDRDIGSLAPDLGQGLVASRRDFALGPVTGGLGLGERLPGIPPQHPKKAEKDRYRPDGQGGLRFHRIGLACTLGGMARNTSLMAEFRLGLDLVPMRGCLRRPLGMARRRCK